MSIAVVGNVFVDIKGFPFEKYIPAGRNAGRVETVHGGVGRNVAEDIANLELRPKFISMVDDSGNGQDVIRKLKKHKVNTDYVITTKNGMGMWLAVFDEKGDVIGSVSNRPYMKPLADLIAKKGDEIFPGCDSIVIEIDIDKEAVKNTFYYAEKYNIPVYAVVANMTIAAQRRDFLRRTKCFVCNEQEAGILFVDSFENLTIEETVSKLEACVKSANFPSMIVTLGGRGSVYASLDGEAGYCPAMDAVVKDTTGAGDSFCAGVAAALTYGKSLAEACAVGTRLAASVITVSENVCPRFMPRELGIDMDPPED